MTGIFKSAKRTSALTSCFSARTGNDKQFYNPIFPPPRKKDSGSLNFGFEQMKFILLIGFLAPCSSQARQYILLSDCKGNPALKRCVSDGITKRNIGPFTILAPKGWSIDQFQSGENQLGLSMSPEPEIFPYSKRSITITYFKSKNDKLFADRKRRTESKKEAPFVKDPIIRRPFNRSGFKGQSVQYKNPVANNENFVAAGIKGDEALLITVMDAAGKLSEMKQIMSSMFH